MFLELRGNQFGLFPSGLAERTQTVVVVPFAAFACFGMPHYINSHSRNVSLFALKWFIDEKFKAELTDGIL